MLANCRSISRVVEGFRGCFRPCHLLYMDAQQSSRVEECSNDANNRNRASNHIPWTASGGPSLSTGMHRDASDELRAVSLKQAEYLRPASPCRQPSPRHS